MLNFKILTNLLEFYASKRVSMIIKYKEEAFIINIRE